MPLYIPYPATAAPLCFIRRIRKKHTAMSQILRKHDVPIKSCLHGATKERIRLDSPRFASIRRTFAHVLDVHPFVPAAYFRSLSRLIRPPPVSRLSIRAKFSRRGAVLRFRRKVRGRSPSPASAIPPGSSFREQSSWRRNF
jgi:hypothetical protein